MEAVLIYYIIKIQKKINKFTHIYDTNGERAEALNDVLQQK